MARDVAQRPVVIRVDTGLDADLAVPEPCQGVVMFAHGSGSGRHSPRNRMVAAHLQQAGLATVLLDLLTAEEERVDAMVGRYRFDIELLADRLAAAGDWVGRQPELAGLPLGYFGASTGAAAALIAAAEGPQTVRAVVSRGGRVDLAGRRLRQVPCPVLLVVGSQDGVVLRLNREAMARLGAAELAVVDGATHLFEEPGALEKVASLATDWFTRHLQPAVSPRQASPG